jgi:hypothetical protein
LDVSVCSEAIKAVDVNAEKFWPVILRKTGVASKRGRVVDERRAFIFQNFGVPELEYRLSCQGKRENGGGQDHVARAQIWLHVAEASSKGDNIADLSAATMYRLNPFLPKDKRFPSPLDSCVRDRTGKPGLPKRLCENERCTKGPDDTRAIIVNKHPATKYCSPACRALANRGYSSLSAKKVARRAILA